MFICADISCRTSKGVLCLEIHRSSFPSLSGIEVATTHQEHCRVHRASARYPTSVTWLLGSRLCVLSTPGTFSRMYPVWALSFSCHNCVGTGGQRSLDGNEQLYVSQSRFLNISGLGMGVGQPMDKQTL